MIITIHSSRKKVHINLLKFIFALFVISMVIFGTTTIFNNSNTAMSAPTEFDTVVVKSGDTLWSIASRCNDGSSDTRVIIEEIIQHNNLASSSLQAGQVIEIPGCYSID